MSTGGNWGDASSVVDAAEQPRARKRWWLLPIVGGAAVTALVIWFSLPLAPPAAIDGAGRRDMSDADSHATMLRTLRDIRDRTAVENPYLGEARLRELQSEASQVGANAPQEAVFVLRAAIGGQLLRQKGRTDEAIQEMEAAAELLPRVREALPPGVESRFLLELAVSHLRRGENENCVHCESREGCLLPIRGGGVHDRPRGSQMAAKYLAQLLEKSPDDLGGAWLMNIAHMTLGSYPSGVPEQFRIPPERFQSEAESPEFVNVAAEAGIDTLNLSGGSIVDDFDNDGWLDIVTSTWDTAGQIRYFRNVGDGTFSDQTAQANLVGIFGGLNLLQADYDNDGDVDVLVLRGAWLGKAGQHPNSLLRNDGGRFTDVTFAAGLADESHPTQTAAWSDYDLDGDLDLYVGNEQSACQLFENQGDGRFVDVAASARVLNRRYTKGVVWGDFDNDRRPDLYVSNLDSSNRLYRNLGDGTFRDVAEELGVEKPQAGFPTWFWDFNNDGALDLLAMSYDAKVGDVAANYLGRVENSEPDRLYRGDGEGGFTEVAAATGLTMATMPMGSNFGDINYDGFPDFYLGTGRPNYRAFVPNMLYLNQAGERFVDITTAANVGHLQKGHGVAFADFDHDGDQDIFIQMGGALPGDAFHNALFENPGFGNRWIVIRLEGVQSNRSAIGARIRVDFVEAGKNRSVFKWVGSGGSFGANPLRQEIGLGRAERIDKLEVYWPMTDTRQVFENLPVNQALVIVEGRGTPESLTWKSFSFRH
ncbi:MAG: CRTAC1 family protein [Pirellulaceae bacterium]|jgi:hypothetical protein|nr:CRTAC1 family protein [Pirellulaceae bacterium]